MAQWQPSADFSVIARRASLLADIRQYFAQCQVLEVETPLLASAPVSDPHIEAIQAFHHHRDDAYLYLQTSPEFAMKRMLAAGSGPIYQICKAFRRGEQGSRHNPEFTMLEWYRPGFSLAELADELVAVIRLALGAVPVQTLSYREVFLEHCGLDPHAASATALRACAVERIDIGFDSDDRDLWLQLLMSSVVEPALVADQITIVDDFPASQAALAKVAVDQQGVTVARRFEAFYGGMELANAYDELLDPRELVRRIRDDHRARAAAGQTMPPIDRHLLKAMTAGLPNCAGVAVGLDRLLMLCCERSSIDQVLSFASDRV